MDDTVKTRWQYSLKTYLMVIAVIALAIGWWCDRQRLQSQLDEARRRIQVLETSPYYDVIPLVR
ncbi:MAG: hypothetical protein QGF59_08665 [Pirellulaceae bacterium]|jgi:hypothetical protein|nr:hypothetical protein [Pirellulaceae bacterium]